MCVEQALSDIIKCRHAVALSSGTAALHMAIRASGHLLFSGSNNQPHVLRGKRVFCQDLTFIASVNPVLYEGGEVVLIDSESETWNMDPEALKRAFEVYPEVKIVVVTHLFGTPAKMKQILEICGYYGAIVIEDSAESFGSLYNGNPTGSLGDIGIISFNGNKIITGSSGGALLTNSDYISQIVRKWANQSKEMMPWYEHSELGFNYRMSNIIAGILRGQILHYKEHIRKKSEIYRNYLKGLISQPISMNPFQAEVSIPNHRLSCLLIENGSLSDCKADGTNTKFEVGKTSPQEIIEVLKMHNVEARRIWKPMHCQPLFRQSPFFMKTGMLLKEEYDDSVSYDLFKRGVCLPSDIKMNHEQQSIIIDIIKECLK